MSKWKMVSIPDVVYYQEGPGVRNTQYTTSGVKLLNVANLQDGKIDLSKSDRYISEDEAYSKYTHFLVDDGDFIIACSGIQVEYFEKKMGFINALHLPLCMNTSTMRFKSLDDNRLFMRFFMYYLKTPQFKEQLKRLITGSAQLNFGPSHIRKMNIPLPPLAIQKKIADVLDKASALIELRKAQLDKLDLLIKSQFVEMFGDPVTNPKGWDIGTIRNLVSDVKYGTSKPAEDNGQYIYLRMNNITYEGGIDLSDIKYINMEEKEVEKYIVRKGDLLFNRTNSKELVGKTAVFRNDTPVIIAGYVIRVRTNEKANTEYISAYLNSMYGKNTLLNICKAIVGQANINAQELQNISIPLTPISLQNQFASFVENVEQQKKLLQQSLSKLEVNYKSLMQKCFRGDIF